MEEENKNLNNEETEENTAPMTETSPEADTSPTAETSSEEKKEDAELTEEELAEQEKIAYGKQQKEKGIGIGIAIGSGLVLLLVAVIIGTGIIMFRKLMPTFFPTQNTQVAAEDIPDNRGIDLDTTMQKLQTMKTIIEARYLFNADTEKVEDGICAGMMAGLEDPYSVYYGKSDYKELTEDTSGRYGGIGAMLQKDYDKNTLTITKVFEGSPAEEAGLRIGDIIYMVEDLYAEQEDFDTLVSEHIKGEEGTPVQITVLRDGEQITVTCIRRQLENPTVSYEMMGDTVGYIEVTQFMANTYEQFVKAIEDLRAQGAKSLVIDLRDNPGGVLDAAVEMADYILPEGLITYTADKTGNGIKYYSDDNHQLDMPIVLLVNQYSASASEVFTGALMDYHAAKVIGTNTFGKGIVQNIIALGDGTAIKITTEHYYTPSGFDLHGEGLVPHCYVELSSQCHAYCDENDNQFQKALEMLK